MSRDAFTRDIEKRINAAVAHVERDERKAQGWYLPTAKNVIARIRKGLSPHVGKHHDLAVDKCLMRLRDEGVIGCVDVSGFRLEVCPRPKHRERTVQP